MLSHANKMVIKLLQLFEVRVAMSVPGQDLLEVRGRNSFSREVREE